MNRFALFASLATATALLSACQKREATEPGLAVAGSYVTDFGSTVTITDDSFNETGVDYEIDYEIVDFDNAGMYFITRDADAEEGMQYSKYVWVEDDGVLYNCVALFGQETPEDAAGEDDADPTDLEMGCGTFAWTRWDADDGSSADAGAN